jgi:hypothetical protein
MRAAFAFLALAAAVAPLSAQEYAVSRRAYTFFERGLTIEVLSDGPGALQILRGEPGRLEVAAHARDGLAAWSVAGWYRDRLRLSALGASEADYVVIVPEDVHVSVSLPGERLARSVSWEPAALLRWEGSPGAGEDVADFGAISGPLAGGLFPVHRDARAPALVELTDLGSVRTLEVRIEGDAFLVASSRPLTFRPGSGPLVIRAGGVPLDLVLTLPRGTARFELRGPQGLLLRADGDALHSGCQPAIGVSLPDRESLRLEPGAADFRCR